MSAAIITLPTATATHPVNLPATYIKARMALTECDRLDECQSWADKAAALASYAKQAHDSTLLAMAKRIQARAVRRCGELLQQIEPAQGGDRRSKGGHAPVDSRKAAASDAGLSEHQRKQALRVANVPEPDFERAIESDTPPTVTALAARGVAHAEPKGSRHRRSALFALQDLEYALPVDLSTYTSDDLAELTTAVDDILTMLAHYKRKLTFARGAS